MVVHLPFWAGQEPQLAASVGWGSLAAYQTLLPALQGKNTQARREEATQMEAKCFQTSIPSLWRGSTVCVLEEERLCCQVNPCVDPSRASQAVGAQM